MHCRDEMRVLYMTHGKTITLLLRFSLPLFLCRNDFRDVKEGEGA